MALRRTHNKQFLAAVSTTAVSAWVPATGRRVRVNSGVFALTSATADVTIIVKDGTSAAAGTLAQFRMDNGGAPVNLDFGDNGLFSSAVGGTIALQSDIAAAGLSAFMVGREERA